MAVFAYKALDGRRTATEGTVAADTPRQARDLLRGRGLIVRQIVRQQSAAGRRVLWRRFSTGTTAKLAATIRELATLLGVGIPLTEALDTLARQHRGRLRTSLLLVRDRVTAGAGLAEALAEQPEVFDPLSVRMVEVGENSGSLEGVLDQLADYKERSLQLKDRVVTALLYPSIVLAVSLAVSLFLMTVVVPMLLDNLLSAGRELPWPTRVLKAGSDLLLQHGWLLAGAAVSAVAALVVGIKTDVGRRLWHRALLRIPLVGPMALKQTISRIALVMSTLIGSGVVYLSALEIAARATSNLVIRDALQTSGRRIAAGEEIGRALAASGVFPPLVIHIFSVGQQSGRLEEMLARLATDYDRQVNSLSTRLASALEPILILALSVFVGFILFATLLPILEAGNVL